jgi:hypothetical protein
MSYSKKQLQAYDHKTLIATIEDLQQTLKGKNRELKDVRMKLRITRSKILKMKEMLRFQGKRILELYQNYK